MSAEDLMMYTAAGVFDKAKEAAISTEPLSATALEMQWRVVLVIFVLLSVFCIALGRQMYRPKDF